MTLFKKSLEQINFYNTIRIIFFHILQNFVLLAKSLIIDLFIAVEG